ncbi:hypothetical protein OpiT1DRAFT_00437 [Opitutaceae bacterium TAV1]|nr:hypothetical protein OpiT1DRAFT_00437 [Opitutaceae bacterium TAV1]
MSLKIIVHVRRREWRTTSVREFRYGQLFRISCLLALSLALVCAGGGEARAATDERTEGGIYERTVKLVGTDDRDLTFFVKLPPGARTGEDVGGVFAFCTWQSDPETIREVLLDQAKDGTTSRVSRFAFERNMAVVSWTTFSAKGAFDRSRSFDEMKNKEIRQFDREFTRIARKWRSGVDGLITDYRLPKNGWLLYGISRGGQWAHRIALREPDLFAAVHVHINSSYDQPVPEAAGVRWLVTTGELEAGYPAARQFFTAARKLGYPMIFHAEQKLGHDNSPAIDRLSGAFFTWVVDNLRAARTGQPAPVTEAFAGDYLTHEYVPAARAEEISAELRVPLPSRPVAEAWGLPAE